MSFLRSDSFRSERDGDRDRGWDRDRERDRERNREKDRGRERDRDRSFYDKKDRAHPAERRESSRERPRVLTSSLTSIQRTDSTSSRPPSAVSSSMAHVSPTHRDNLPAMEMLPKLCSEIVSLLEHKIVEGSRKRELETYRKAAHDRFDRNNFKDEYPSVTDINDSKQRRYDKSVKEADGRIQVFDKQLNAALKSLVKSLLDSLPEMRQKREAKAANTATEDVVKRMLSEQLGQLQKTRQEEELNAKDNNKMAIELLQKELKGVSEELRRHKEESFETAEKVRASYEERLRQEKEAFEQKLNEKDAADKATIERLREELQGASDELRRQKEETSEAMNSLEKRLEGLIKEQVKDQLTETSSKMKALESTVDAIPPAKIEIHQKINDLYMKLNEAISKFPDLTQFQPTSAHGPDLDTKIAAMSTRQEVIETAVKLLTDTSVNMKKELEKIDHNSIDDLADWLAENPDLSQLKDIQSTLKQHQSCLENHEGRNVWDCVSGVVAQLTGNWKDNLANLKGRLDKLERRKSPASTVRTTPDAADSWDFPGQPVKVAVNQMITDRLGGLDQRFADMKKDSDFQRKNLGEGLWDECKQIRKALGALGEQVDTVKATLENLEDTFDTKQDASQRYDNLVNMIETLTGQYDNISTVAMADVLISHIRSLVPDDIIQVRERLGRLEQLSAARQPEPDDERRKRQRTTPAV